MGGVPDYEEVLEALEGKVEPGQEEWTAERLAWLPVGFDPNAFDTDDVNQVLREGPMPPLEEWHPVPWESAKTFWDVRGQRPLTT